MTRPTQPRRKWRPSLPTAVAVLVAAALAGGPIAFSHARTALGAVLPPTLGTVTPVVALPKDCPSGSVCAGYRISCPGVSQQRIAFTATRVPVGTPRGMVLLFSGDIGRSWWSGETGSVAFLGRLRAAGFTTVQVKWEGGWSVAAPGEDAGTGHLACRPASMIRWIHDNRFVPLRLPARPIGECGFCVTGNSGGASQVSYALSFYALDSILDGVFPTSGPPQAAQDKGCLRRVGEGPYRYGGNAVTIDMAHGFLTGGPCARSDISFTSRWLAESVDTGGNDFFHPATRVYFIHSDFDIPAVPHALDYIRKLRAAGTPLLVERIIPGMPHRLQASQAGLDALYSALVAASVSK